MGSVFFVVGPVRGENLVGLPAEQEVEFLLEDAVELFAELLIEIRHHPAAELEALGRILPRPTGCLHDAIHGNHGADDNLPHGHSPRLNLGRTQRACPPAADARGVFELCNQRSTGMSNHICDFCSEPGVTWCYPAHNFLAYAVAGIVGESVGDWAACRICHGLIAAGDRRGLLDRSLRTLLEKNPEMIPAEAELREQ